MMDRKRTIQTHHQMRRNQVGRHSKPYFLEKKTIICNVLLKIIKLLLVWLSDRAQTHRVATTLEAIEMT